ncbi:hypothetical protein [Marinobacterium lutimaris]|uniref:Uncharacterized protein n=1 Tax=Marinobacterium lutimaris TaxID=568106 RepID=A0A1H5XM37_9GAMM|nr:hypothetical protein [Marinobacterium lutimaris]SEG12732.1 hypothetical protein SAMN05444390_1011432 [Marinobacterium lutimaris]
MARTMIDHACEGCGAVRKVSPDKLARGQQRLCRKCQGPAAAEKRRIAMLKRGGPKHVTFGICNECRGIYEMASIEDDGYCCDKCREKASSRGCSTRELAKRYLYGPWSPRRVETYKGRQLALFGDRM